MASNRASFPISSRVPTCYPSQKTSDVQNYILNNMSDYDTVNYIYVLSKEKKLHGVISIKELFAASNSKLIRSYMTTRLIKARAHSSPEKIAQLSVQHSIKSMPIVDKSNTFLGIVRSKDIIKIVNQEATEDFLLLSGIVPTKDVQQDEIPLIKSVINRSPWVIIGLFGGLMAASIIGQFEAVLEKEVLLVAFVPLIVYIANAVGAQTQTLYIRDLALFSDIHFLKYSIKQIVVTAVIGLLCWAIITGVTVLMWQNFEVGMIVGFSAFASIIGATIFAMIIPFILRIAGKDPAVGSGPFTTILQDIASIIIYFAVATVFLL